jgi:hypothetical protein
MFRAGFLEVPLGVAGQAQAVARYEALPRSGADLPSTVIVDPRAGGLQSFGKTTKTLRAPAEMYPSQVVVVQMYGSNVPVSVVVPFALTDCTGFAKSPVKPTTKSTTITTTATTTTGSPQTGRCRLGEDSAEPSVSGACSGALGGFSMALVR